MRSSASAEPAAAPPLVSFRGTTKRFGELTACEDVTFDIAPGEVAALLGENGAGKSTLMKTLYGIHAADGGEILVDGRRADFGTPRDAMAARIGMVFQTFSILPALSVRDNLMIAWPGTPWFLGRSGRRARGAVRKLRDLAPGIDPDRRAGDLSIGEQQLVELAKVLNLDARLVILDEPTSVLTPAEAERLYTLIRDLAARGVAVILITHKLADVEACADRLIIMRRGRIVADGPAKGQSRADIVTAMMGQARNGAPRAPARPSHPVPRLVLRGVSSAGVAGGIQGIDLTVHRGEILGIAGVTGNGQSALAEAVAGVAPVAEGEVLLDGTAIERRDGAPPKPVALGYVPENPRLNAVVPGLDLAANLCLRSISDARAHPSPQARIGPVQAVLEDHDIRPPEPRRLAQTLSGGNLQKLVIARETEGAPRAVLLVYPTMGLDVAATEAVYRRMILAAGDGASVLWISEELDDLLELAHRIAVLRSGRIVATLDNDGSLTRERIGALMTGAER